MPDLDRDVCSKAAPDVPQMVIVQIFIVLQNEWYSVAVCDVHGDVQPEPRENFVL